MLRLRRHCRLLRTAMLLFVALGVLLQPLIWQLGDLHELEHAAALHSDHGHSHHDGHDDHGDPGRDEGNPGDPIGAHTLLHQAGFAVPLAIPEGLPALHPPVTSDGPPDRARADGPPTSRLTLPFRPPIA